MNLGQWPSKAGEKHFSANARVTGPEGVENLTFQDARITVI